MADKTTDGTGNPAPLGLLGFGMTTILLNFHNAGFYPIDSMVLSMGIFFGGIAQVIAGIMEWKKGNTFATTAFISYGFFWLVLVGLILMPKMALGIDGPASDTGMALFLFLWGLFTLAMFMGTLHISKALQVVFGLLTVLFFLLAASDALDNKAIAHVAGYEGILCGLAAMYTGLAQVLNEVAGKTIWPLGLVAKKKGS